MSDFISNAIGSLIISLFLLIPLGRKWGLYPLQIGVAVLAFTAVNGTAGTVFGLGIGEQPFRYLLLNGLLMVIEIPLAILPFFYRDPERVPPPEEQVIVSPADGKVIYVKPVQNNQAPLCTKAGQSFEVNELIGAKFLSGGGYLIGISMNFMDVHVNRAPIEGIVRQVNHIGGHFLSLRAPEAVLMNERQSLVLEGPQITVAIVQIASRLVRRIVAYVAEGDQVTIGQRIGMIKFGSQVDLVLPQEGIRGVEVEIGDVVRAGTTIIARFEV